MARRTITETIDDLDGTIIEEGGTHTFSLDGEQWEIDLTPEHFAELQEALARFIAGGRLTSRPRVRGAGKTRRDSRQAAKIREWALENGYEISAKGRIPQPVEEAYNNAQNGIRTVRNKKSRRAG